MSNPQQIILKYVVDNYGDLITADTPSYDEATKNWISRLRSTYPRIIEDEKSKEVVVHFLRLTGLGVIKLNENLEVVEATSSDNCEYQLESRLDLWKRHAEQIVVSASSDVFARIAESIHVLNPLKVILDQLTKSRKDGLVILNNEIDQQKKPERVRRYLNLLEELTIIRRVEKGYAYDNAFVSLAEEVGNNPKDLRMAILSMVFKRKYPTLRQVFGITQLEPFVHLANAYYWPSLDAEKLIHITPERLFKRYQRYYDDMTRWDFESKLSDLIDEKAIIEEDGYLIGNESRFKSMLEMKPQVQLNP